MPRGSHSSVKGTECHAKYKLYSLCISPVVVNVTGCLSNLCDYILYTLVFVNLSPADNECISARQEWLPDGLAGWGAPHSSHSSSAFATRNFTPSAGNRIFNCTVDLFVDGVIVSPTGCHIVLPISMLVQLSVANPGDELGQFKHQISDHSRSRL